jgi:hypothetical protein
MVERVEQIQPDMDLVDLVHHLRVGQLLDLQVL